MFTTFLAGFGLRRKITLSIAFDQTDYDLFVAAGSPADPVDVEVTLDTTIKLTASATTIPCFSTGTGWKPSSTLTFINNGDVIGAGGDAGDGGVSSSSAATAGDPGVDGGDTIDLAFDMSIDNTNGNIFAGGGGGGGGGSAVGSDGSCQQGHLGGSGGGGGAGDPGGALGAGASVAGLDGTVGITVGGVGGAQQGPTSAGVANGAGGNGGDYGEDGIDGFPGTATGNECGWSNQTGLGGAAGLGGNAVQLNSNAVTWLGGNNPTQVKGDVA